MGAEALNDYILSEIADVVDCEHKTAPKVDSSKYCSVRTTDILNGKIDYENANRVSEETYAKWTKRATPESEDIVLAREAPVGEVGWIKDGYRVCLGQRTVLIRVTHSEVSKRFLLYHLVNPETKYELQVRSGGSVVAHLNMKDIRNFKLSLPPLPEQKAIAQVLSSLDDKIDLLHRQNKTLEAITETLFRQWFIEETQDDWEEEILEDYISVKHGYAFKGKFISKDKSDQVLVTPGNFKIGGGFKMGKTKYYHDSDFPKGYILEKDDLVLTMTDLSKQGDTLGYPALIPARSGLTYLHNQRIGKVIFDSSLSKYFLYFLMRTAQYQWYILGTASGTSVRHTSPTSICNYSFLMPSKSKMNEFDVVASSSLDKVSRNISAIATLEKLRDTLLPQIISGEVRVAVEPDLKAA
ncbi:MAG: restriction endonuclease subunit S [Phormidesmis sp.]